MTLIELTVVIVVLLSLLGVLSIATSVWIKGSNRASAILVIRNAQQGVRSHINITGYKETSYPDLPLEIFGTDKYVFNGRGYADGELPEHPRKELTFGFAQGDSNLIPDHGTLYICTGGASSLNDTSYNPAPSVYDGW